MLVLPLYELLKTGLVLAMLVLFKFGMPRSTQQTKKGLWKRSDGRLDASCVHRHHLLSGYATIRKTQGIRRNLLAIDVQVFNVFYSQSDA